MHELDEVIERTSHVIYRCALSGCLEILCMLVWHFFGCGNNNEALFFAVRNSKYMHAISKFCISSYIVQSPMKNP